MRTYVRLALLLAAVLALGMLASGEQPAHAWSYPAALNTNATSDSTDDNFPQVAADGAGNLVAVWDSDDDLGGTIGTDYDILVARSDDNGATWTTAAALTTNSAWDRFPRVATDDGTNWLAVWMSSDDLGGAIGSDVDILVSRSTDNGATWTSPIALDTNAASDSDFDGDGCQAVASDGGDNWVAVWDSQDHVEGNGTDCDMVAARSTDNGATWSDPTTLSITPACDPKGGGACFNPRVATDGGGNWVAVWESKENLGGTIGTDYDILTARSTDNAATWMAPTALNTNAGTDSEDDGGPEVATDGEGNWLTVWGSEEDVGGIGTDGDVLVSRSTDNGEHWTDPEPLNTNAATDSGYDGDPHVATDGGGNWLAVWESDENLGGTIGTDPDILVSRSTDNGATWSDPGALNTNAASDSGDDDDSQVATDGAGNWVMAWESDENVGGSIGTDYDILYAICSALDADCDETPDASDNCPDVYNPGQDNYDGDAWGDACDPDDDNDTVADGEDTDPLDPYVCRDIDNDTCDDCSVLGVADPLNDGTNSDWDRLCDAGDPDDDNDGLDDAVDPCSLDPDCDDDGYWDGVETEKGSQPLDANSTPEVCDGQDNDGDTLVDEGYDYNGNTVPDCTEEGLDSDGDTIPNTTDDDDDDDGFSDAAENYMGLDSLSDCGPDAWAPDVNDDAEVDILDVLHYAGKLRAAYDRRYDLNADGHVDILDVLVYKWELGKTCPKP